jgi:hypothetical protein
MEPRKQHWILELSGVCCPWTTGTLIIAYNTVTSLLVYLPT